MYIYKRKDGQEICRAEGEVVFNKRLFPAFDEEKGMVKEVVKSGAKTSSKNKEA